MKYLIDYHLENEGAFLFYSAVVEGKDVDEAKMKFKQEGYYIDSVSELN